MEQNQFTDIVEYIRLSRINAIKAVNTELLNLYWNIGAFISLQLKNARWGEKTVDELAGHIRQYNPEIKGFDRRGLYRMKQFYETYSQSSLLLPGNPQRSVVAPVEIVSAAGTQLTDTEFVSAAGTQIETQNIRYSLLVKLSWTHHRTIFSRCGTPEERAFYVKMGIRENWSVRQLDRQISTGLFERSMLGKANIPGTLKQTHTGVENALKDNYILEFLNLPESYNEADLQKGLVSQIKDFIIELGRDFLFIDQEYKLQVGNSDFYIDLLFYHRDLQCLVAFELKADKFKPEHLGQLNFYLEALDRDVRKPNENPSIGILLCKDKDDEVVEYALSRSLSPAMVSRYQTKLPDKKLLQQKMHEIFPQ